MALFNFRLKHPDAIVPWGKEGDRSIHWFGLTDGEYWIELPEARLFEYTVEAVQYFERPPAERFADYQVTRLVEDLFHALPNAHISIPDNVFERINTHEKLYTYFSRIHQWKENEPEDEYVSDEFVEKSEALTEWLRIRCADSLHFINGPYIWLLRNGERITIVWHTEGTTDKGDNFWTAAPGQYEMSYAAFVEEVDSFAKRFFDAMQKQVVISIEKDWGDVRLDKQNLAREQVERRVKCEKIIDKLRGREPRYDWTKTENAICELLK